MSMEIRSDGGPSIPPKTPKAGKQVLFQEESKIAAAGPNKKFTNDLTRLKEVIDKTDFSKVGPSKDDIPKEIVKLYKRVTTNEYFSESEKKSLDDVLSQSIRRTVKDQGNADALAFRVHELGNQ